MKIAISGAQGTGKTTLVNELMKLKQFKNYIFKANATRQIKEAGFKINEESNNLVQLFVISEHVQRLIYKDIIGDRSILDGVVYTHHQYNKGKVDKWVLDYAEKICQEHIHSYDLLFYIEPEFGLVSDGVRSSDKTYRDEIVRLFRHYIKKYNVSVIKLTGPGVERIAQFKKEVANKIIIRKASLEEKPQLTRILYKIGDELLLTFREYWSDELWREFPPTIAVMNNKIIGFHTYTINKKYRDCCKSYYFIVHPNFQRKGIGKKLIQEMIQACRLRKCNKFLTVCNTHNFGGNFYKSLGLRPSSAKTSEFGAVDEYFELSIDKLDTIIRKKRK